MLKYKKLSLVFGISLLLLVIGAFTYYLHTKPVKQNWIIDTDMATPSAWNAGLYMLKSPEAKILAISVVGTGEGHCPIGAQNAKNMLLIAGKIHESIPVACGATKPLQGNRQFPALWRKLTDAVYGFHLKQNKQPPVKIAAVHLITNILKSSKQPVSILTFGPLTNIGILLTQHPKLKAEIKQIVIMGGAIHVKGNLPVPGVTDYIKNTVAEWNIYIDPQAAKIVFHSGIPVVLIPLDATNRMPLSKRFLKRLTNTATTPAAKFMVAELHTSAVSADQIYFWDELTAVVALHPKLCQYEYHKIDVITNNSLQSGRTVLSNAGAPIKVCINADLQTAEKIFIKVLNS